MRFSLVDDREDEFNESVDLSFDLYADPDDEIMSMETYHNYCKRFAAAMGFAQATIEEWFGEY